MPRITLPDGSSREIQTGATVADVADMIGPRLARSAIGGKIDGEVVDLGSPLTRDCQIKILTPSVDDADSLHLLRHSCAHIMAEAICSLFPETKLVYGPPVENGFYYDVDLDRPLTPEDFAAIEARMAEIIKADRPFVRYEMDRDEGMRKLQAEGNRYKIDNAERAEGKLSFYVTGERSDSAFEDLCRGPHVPSTGRIGAFKVMQVSGAYYRGDQKEKQLQRIYGTAWPTKKDLEAHLFRLEEARKRDHRVLGKQLGIFSIHEEIGPGLIHWHPRGGMIRHLVENFWKDEHLKRGYDIVFTPHIASERIYRRSGHLEKYGDMMYSPMDIDGLNYYLKPMNCPGHYMIYLSDIRSYRDLPIRMCELGTVYRYEPSGTLHGMLRVRGFTQDDAHTFCTPEQLGQELDMLLELMDLMMRTFGYQYKAYLATRPEKYLGTLQEWERATNELQMAMERRGLAFEVDEGGGVFYAPKIDIKLIDSMGREWQGPTIQVDLQAAKRFEITYVGADNAPHETIIIHRTVLGSMERFIGGLIEHYGGAFPMWLAPVQILLASVSEKSADYAREVLARLKAAGLRTRLDVSHEKIGPKKHAARQEKIPYILVVGEKEAAEGTVNVNDRSGKSLGNQAVDAFIAHCRKLVAERALEPGA
ncbi:MAG: threonine--tRNA ligase [Phycisphaerales bacterium]|nr:threonine--tRNA ligase [Phycisphaerales bacterium]